MEKSKTNNIYKPEWDSLDKRPIPKWFEEYKFGIFVHWGVYSVPSWRGIHNSLFGSYAEWYYASVYGKYRNHDPEFHKNNYGEKFRYRDFAEHFKAELFDPDAWAKLFAKAGAKYVVLTSKHHDGYCLWPTKNRHKKNWRVMDLGPDKDLLGLLTKSVKKQNLKMGIYYSMIEFETNWTHRTETGYFVPDKDRLDFGIDESLYSREILLPQLKELVNSYEPELIFADGGEWDLTEDYTQIKEFLTWLYNESPVKDTIVVNDRFFKGMPENHGDYFSTEYKDKDGFGNHHPWEESRGIGKSYGFNRAEKLVDYQSFESLVKALVDIISTGGNFLLNIGPTADGRIPVIQEERLIQLGRWLEINGEAIYGTTGGLFNVVNLPTTRKDGCLYCFIFAVTSTLDIIVKNFKVHNVRILGLGLCQFRQNADKITIELPELAIYQMLNQNKIDFSSFVICLS